MDTKKIIGFFLSISIISFSWQGYFGKISWHLHNKLSEKDFRVKVFCPDRKIAEAFTTVNPSINHWGNHSGVFEYQFITTFNKDSSWMCKSALNDGLTLKHEQGHYDISEICARVIRKEFAVYPFSYASYYEEIDSLLENSKSRLDSMQNLYDSRCGYGKDTIFQNEWSINITIMLDSLKNYSQIDGKRAINKFR